MCQGLGGALSLLLNKLVQGFAQGRFTNANKTPGLHQANAGRLVGGVEQAVEGDGVDVAAGEVAHIPAFGNHPVDGVDIPLGVA